MRYYYAEHEAAYRRLEQEGKTQWNDLFEEGRPQDFEAFPNRGFLEHALPYLDLPSPPEVDVLEYVAAPDQPPASWRHAGSR
ncbi:hypothetical protein [Actinopolymorpha pittospori]